MPEAKTGDTVKVHYAGTLADGTQFDSSVGTEPLVLTLGEGSMIAGFDDQQVMVDGNHPLAGQDLIFDLELVQIA